MTRKQSNTVDYFPHTARSGKTLFVLESKFGNDAYAFWFKLLELLSISENHFYDCNIPTNWEYLIAKTRSDDISATEMLAILSKLGNIDAELWENKIIWCQALVDNIADVYKNRKRSLPQKPKIPNNYSRNATTADISTVEMQENQQNVDYQGQTTVEKRQSKVNKSKVNTTTTTKESKPCGINNASVTRNTRQPSIPQGKPVAGSSNGVVVVVEDFENEDLKRLVAHLDPVLQKQVLVKDMLKKYLAERGYQYVESNITYATRNAKKSGSGLLAESLKNDYGEAIRAELEGKAGKRKS